MSTENGYLPLLLDGPMQSWGSGSRFQRRTTGLYPTKSGVIGLICAAMGLAKGSDPEDKMLPRLRDLRMDILLLLRPKPWIPQPRLGQRSDWLEIRRMEDYHTVGGGFDAETEPYSVPWTASGHPDEDATVSRREYLFDARFGVILVGGRDVLAGVAEALRHPVWGTWLGRKSCIPAAPVFAGGPFDSEEEAWKALLAKALTAKALVSSAKRLLSDGFRDSYSKRAMRILDSMEDPVPKVAGFIEKTAKQG